MGEAGPERLHWSLVTTVAELEHLAATRFSPPVDGPDEVFGSIGWATAYIDAVLGDPLRVLVGSQGDTIAHVALLREVGGGLEGLFAEKTDVAPVLLSRQVGAARAAVMRSTLASVGHRPRLRAEALHERDVADLFATFDVIRSWACPVAVLPGWRTRASSGLLAEARRQQRRLEQQVGPVRHRWVPLTDAGVARTTAVNRIWKEARDDVPFARTDRHVELLRLAAKRLSAGRICEAQLHAGDALVSSLVCFVAGTWVGYLFGAHDIAYAAYGPGTINLACTMDWLASADMVAFDFLRGGEPYKYRFGAEDQYRVLSGEGALR